MNDIVANPTKLATLLEDYIAAKKAFLASAQSAMKAAFKEVFDAHPEITAFKWVQYTPYFNDGEPCEFRVGEVTVTNLPLDELDDLTAYGEYDGERKDVYTGSYSDTKRDAPYFAVTSIRGVHYRTKEVTGPAAFETADTSKLEALLNHLNSSALEEVMQSTFGDHVTIVATRDGFDIENYDHD